jgi:hypothetical protein
MNEIIKQTIKRSKLEKKKTKPEGREREREGEGDRAG